MTNSSLKEMFHGKVISYTGESSIKDILSGISRNNMLDPQKVKDNNTLINDNKEILFLPNTIKEFHEESSGKLVYRLLMIGILSDGRKTGVILEDIIPYFEIRKPNNLSEYGFRKKVNAVVKEKCRNAFIKEVYAKGFNKYEDKETLYLRVHTYTSWERKNLMKYFIDILAYETTTDDMTHYERVVCRNENFSMCTWNTIKFKSYNAESICNIDKIFRVKLKDMNKYQGDIMQNDDLAFDKTLVKTWDIEAHTDR
jgi:hypothetical protein